VHAHEDALALIDVAVHQRDVLAVVNIGETVATAAEFPLRAVARQLDPAEAPAGS